MELFPLPPASRTAGRRARRSDHRAFHTALVTALLAQQVYVRRVTRRYRHHLTSVDLLTLTRGVPAAVLLGQAAAGHPDRDSSAGWAPWLALLYGSILCDWLDGPLARRFGSSEAGAILDLEADSWLTLCAALSSVRTGALPRYVALAPALRYPLLLLALRRTSYREAHRSKPRWERHAGIAQMLLFIAALAPFRGRLTSALIRWTAPLITPLQVANLVCMYTRRLSKTA